MKKYIGISILAALAVLLSCCEGDEEPGPSIVLSVQSISDSDRFLRWNDVDNAEEYKISRSVKRNGVTGDPVVLESVSFLTLDYVDKDVPLGGELQYTITATTTDKKEIKSNVATSPGAAKLLIHPYQMKLMPEKNLVVIRDYNTIFLVDYQEQIITKRREFPSKLGEFDLATFNGKKELYVPSSDHNVYILDPFTLDIIDVLSTNYSLQSVAVNSRGTLYLSSSHGQAPLKLYNRGTLSFISQHDGETDCGIVLLSDNKLLTVSKHIDPATMSIYTFNDQGNLISHMDDPYNWNYEMDSERLKVSANHIVTSTDGFVYRADNLTWVKTLEGGGPNYSDFEFSADGNFIYAAVTTSRSIYQYTINATPGATTIATNGYPWMLARNDNELIVLSSPTLFYTNGTTNAIILERIKLN
jgi:hypothetical protein